MKLKILTKKSTKKSLLTLSLMLATTSSTLSHASESNKWSITPFFGISQLQNFDGQANNIDNTSGNTKIELDSGFNSGISFGYRFNRSLSMELGWEYRTNDSSANINQSSRFDDGNYASNSLFLNGYYYLPKYGSWEPFFGAGVVWLQEIDIDLERNGAELSYSSDGDIGLQLIAGVNYELNSKWAIQTQFRYGNISGIDLEGEEGAVGDFTDFDYKPITLQLGAVYRF